MTKVIEADHHRNGVAGEGFYVGIISEGRGSARTRKLVICFPEYDDDDCETLAAWQTRVAVLDLDMAAEGNIYMHPTKRHEGGNAWRGDHYGDAARAIMAAHEVRMDALLMAAHKVRMDALLAEQSKLVRDSNEEAQRINRKYTEGESTE